VIVNETFASKFWPGLDPIGRRVRSRFGGVTAWTTVIGVAKDVKQGGVDQGTGTEVYYVLDQVPRIFPAWVMGNWDGGSMKVVIRSDIPAATILPTLAAAVREVEPALPLIRPRVMDDVIRDSVRRPRMLMQLFVGFAGLALFLAGIGIYGVLSYMVTERRREIGIRLALGAMRQSVLRAVVGHGLTLAGVGLLAGLTSAVALTRLIKTLLFDVEPNDPATLLCVAVGVTAVATAATLLPAHRATRIDPIVALQGDN